tara:strand:- start:1105 stop:1302 length:198 start_codon:yes stop_codon:yes gene_type:complete
MDIAGLLLLVQLLEDEKRKAVVAPIDVVPIDPGLVRGSDPSVSGAPKPIKKVDDTQVRPRGRFGL